METKSKLTDTGVWFSNSLCMSCFTLRYDSGFVAIITPCPNGKEILPTIELSECDFWCRELSEIENAPVYHADSMIDAVSGLELKLKNIGGLTTEQVVKWVKAVNQMHSKLTDHEGFGPFQDLDELKLQFNNVFKPVGGDETLRLL